MKKLKQKVVEVIVLLNVVLISLTAGCASEERLSTKETTKTGKNWAESESVRNYKSADGKTIREKQNFYEKIKCVGKHGERISAVDPDECLEKGGTFVDKVIIDEDAVSNRR